MRKLFLVTVDCDLRADDVGLRNESLHVTMDRLAEAGAEGHTSWLLNENDFQITQNHPEFLHQALGRGDTLGLHDHFEPLKGKYELAPITDICRRSKRQVESWLAANGYPADISLHRNGCLAQHEDIYRALRQLGYAQVSEVWPGNVRTDRDGYHSFDNEDIPPGIVPYRHDPAGFTDYTSREGPLLHFPVTHMFLTAAGGFNWDTIAEWETAFAAKSPPVAPFLWLFHPYEIMNDSRTSIEPRRANLIPRIIDRMCTEYDTGLASIDECREAIENG